MTYELHEMDCRLAMAMLMDENSIDSVVCDPPYGLSKEPDVAEVLRHWLNGDDYAHRSAGFMSASWDSFVPGPAVWREAYRVLKPGGHLVAFFGTRTYDLGVMALRMAGFEIRDQLAWVFGSGFPKSHSVDKAIQKSLEGRYGETRCDCVDCGNGLSPGDDAGRGIRATSRDDGRSAGCSSESLRDSQLSVKTEDWPDSLRQLLETDRTPTPRSLAVEETVLLDGVRQCGSEAPGQRNAPLRAGVEESTRGNTSATAGLSGMRENARNERIGASCPSSEAVSIWRDEPAGQPDRAMRLMPPPGRSNDRTGFVSDPDRHYDRDVHLDDFGGRQSALARVCSWCGYPDREWLATVAPLGSALKPAYEPIVLARKPIASTVAANVLQYGTGAINIDGCRVETTDGYSENRVTQGGDHFSIDSGSKTRGTTFEPSPGGRWPANLCHDGSPEVLAEFPVTGASKRAIVTSKPGGIYGGGQTLPAHTGEYGYDEPAGSAARFFYCAKASKSDRNEGLDDLPPGPSAASQFRPNHAEGAANGEDGNPYGRWSPVKNTHATVKPSALMQWLVRLVTPPGGTVLDPFTGSGTTGVACAREGFNFIGCEMTSEYIPIATRRIAHAYRSRGD